MGFFNLFQEEKKENYKFTDYDIEEIKNRLNNKGINIYDTQKYIDHIEQHYAQNGAEYNIKQKLDTDYLFHFKGMDNINNIYIKRDPQANHTTTQWREIKEILFPYGTSKYEINNEYNSMYFKHIDSYIFILIIKLRKITMLDDDFIKQLAEESYHSINLEYIKYMHTIHSGSHTISLLDNKFNNSKQKEIFKKLNPTRNDDFFIHLKKEIKPAHVSLRTIVTNVTDRDDTSVLKEVPRAVTNSYINNLLKKNTKVAIYN